MSRRNFLTTVATTAVVAATSPRHRRRINSVVTATDRPSARANQSPILALRLVHFRVLPVPPQSAGRHFASCAPNLFQAVCSKCGATPGPKRRKICRVISGVFAIQTGASRGKQKRHGRFRLLYCGIAPGGLVSGLIDQRPESDGSRTTYRRDERVGGTVVAHSNAALVL